MDPATHSALAAFVHHWVNLFCGVLVAAGIVWSVCELGARLRDRLRHRTLQRNYRRAGKP